MNCKHNLLVDVKIQQAETLASLIFSFLKITSYISKQKGNMIFIIVILLQRKKCKLHKANNVY